ncbi:hypothetical protein SDC9_83674 [bioreactor metagenome]|uniref:Uncharacterized protein n=1 Tax=bioreactor metagenome TaxID=1076179 RepID=A0A644Z9X0_9ZZZZ
MIQHHYIQGGLGPLIVRVDLAFHDVSARRHHIQAQVGVCEHAVEVRRLNVLLQSDLGASRDLPGCGLVDFLVNEVLLRDTVIFPVCALQALFDGLVILQPGIGISVHALSGLVRCILPLRCSLQKIQIRYLLTFHLLSQSLYDLFACSEALIIIAERFAFHLKRFILNDCREIVLLATEAVSRQSFDKVLLPFVLILFLLGKSFLLLVFQD